MKNLVGRVAVITGAASGIGRALAVQLAREGCDLALVDLDRGGIEAAAKEVEALGRRATVHVADTGDRSRLAELPEEVVAAHGHVHILVNNAGVALSGTLADSSIEDLDWIVNINFWGVVLGCKHFLPYLEREAEAHIVNLSSLFGLIGLPDVGAYCATKAAVRSYSQTLGAELRNSGVTVTSVHPGGVATRIMHNARVQDEEGRAEIVEMFERRGIAPDRAADRIVDAIKTGKRRLRICRETFISDWFIRLMPVTTSRLVERLWSRNAAREAAG